MKIAVIGAGPGGLVAALTAARQGHQVDLLEKGRVGERIVCGECIFDSLDILSMPDKGLLHPVEEIVLQARGTYRLPAGRYRKLWMVDRESWQQDLACQAVAMGVAVSEQRKVRSAHLREMQGSYDWIIDASGAPSVTSRCYGFSRDYLPGALIAYQTVLSGDFSELAPAVKAAFLSGLPKEAMPGYYWVFPKDRVRANIGVVCTADHHGRTTVDLKGLLCEVLDREGLRGCPVVKEGGGLIPVRVLSRLVYDNILLVGDAAGLASPLHGGGIDTACLSGTLAVNALADGKEGPSRYRQQLLNYLQEKLDMEDLMIRKMQTLSFDQLDELFRAAAQKKASLRTKAALRHPDLLYAAWKWLKQKGSPIIHVDLS